MYAADERDNKVCTNNISDAIGFKLWNTCPKPSRPVRSMK
jgi:hypothetical protein